MRRITTLVFTAQPRSIVNLTAMALDSVLFGKCFSVGKLEANFAYIISTAKSRNFRGQVVKMNSLHAPICQLEHSHGPCIKRL